MGCLVCAGRGDGQGTRHRHRAASCGAVAERGGTGPTRDVGAHRLSAVAVEVSVDNPDTHHIRDATENGQGHRQHSQSYIGRGVRQS
jgi:hypothetical protein